MTNPTLKNLGKHTLEISLIGLLGLASYGGFRKGEIRGQQIEILRSNPSVAPYYESRRILEGRVENSKIAKMTEEQSRQYWQRMQSALKTNEVYNSDFFKKNTINFIEGDIEVLERQQDLASISCLVMGALTAVGALYKLAHKNILF